MQMPLKDDAAIKEYLLSPVHRAKLLASASYSTGHCSCTGQGSPTAQGLSMGQSPHTRQGPPMPEACCMKQETSQQQRQHQGNLAHVPPRAVSASGAVWKSIAGADAMKSLLTEPSFVCMHYKLGPGAQLQACGPEGKAEEVQTLCQQYARYSMLALQ